MNIIIKKATITDPTSPHNGQIADIHIANGKIISIGKDIVAKGAKIVDAPGVHVSPGWIDLFADFADPGYEFRKPLKRALKLLLPADIPTFV